MFDLGWTELLVIGVVALIVIGPKDLPMLFRKVGKFVGKARAMAREFSRAMNDAADEAGVKDVSKTLKAASNPLQTSLDQVKKATSEFASYDPSSETGKLATERAEAAKKIHEDAKKRAIEKRESKQKMAEETPTDKLTSNETVNAKKPATKKKSSPKKNAPKTKVTGDTAS